MTSPCQRLEPRPTLRQHSIGDEPDTPNCAGLKQEPQRAKTSPDVSRPARNRPRHVLLGHHVPSAARRSPPGAVSAPPHRHETGPPHPRGPPCPSPPSSPGCPRSHQDHEQSAIGFPVSRTNLTAPSRNSASNFLRFCAANGRPPATTVQPQAGSDAVVQSPSPEVQAGSAVDAAQRGEASRGVPLNDEEFTMLAALAPLVGSPQSPKDF